MMTAVFIFTIYLALGAIHAVFVPVPWKFFHVICWPYYVMETFGWAYNNMPLRDQSDVFHVDTSDLREPADPHDTSEANAIR